MAQKTLIIGLGTTGLRIIEEAQQYHYEFTGRNKPGDNVEYLYIETDTSRLPKATAGGQSEINDVMFNFSKVSVDIEQLRTRGLNVDWIPKVEYLEQSALGAGGMPSFGRLSLWKSTNFKLLSSKILDKFHDIDGDEDTLIYVVGSLTGGTGSGLCVDIAYLLQNLLPENKANMQALFLLPNRASTDTDMALHENTFSALSALNHYTDVKNPYKVVWPNGSKYTSKAPPYQLVQFMSQDFVNGKSSIHNLGELVKVAGMKVLLTILNTNSPGDFFEDVLARRRVDQVGAGNLGNYNSAGFLMIQYPKAQLKELLSLRVSSKIINTIIDAEKFTAKSGAINLIESKKASFEKNTINDFEEILEEALNIFDNITSPEGLIMADDINSSITQIMSGALSGNDEREVHNKFNTTNTNSYYGNFNSNKAEFRNSIIDNLNSYADTITEKYKNLVITRLHIEKISDYIDELIVFYKERYNLDGKENSWDNYLGIQIDKLFNNKTDFNLTFTKRDYYIYIMYQMKDALKLQIIIPELIKLKEQLHSERPIKSLNGKRLPSIAFISNMISDCNKLANGDDDLMTLHRRQSELESSLEKYSTSFRMLFETGKMENDIDNALDKYNRSDSKIDSNILFNSSIWNFVQQDNDSMYRKVIKNAVGFINEKELFSTSLIEIINKLDPHENNENQKLKRLFASNKNQIRKSVPAMFGIHEDFDTGQDEKSKLFVLTSDSNSYNRLLEDYTLDTGTQQNTVDLPDLKDVLVYYQEYATTTNLDDLLLNPIHHIGTMPYIKNHIKDKLKKDDKKNETTYFLKKSPYLTREQLNKIIS